MKAVTVFAVVAFSLGVCGGVGVIVGPFELQRHRSMALTLTVLSMMGLTKIL